MKGKLVLGFLLVGLTLTGNNTGRNGHHLLALTPAVGAQLPDAPPPGPPLPGEPVMVRPRPPKPPEDFQETRKENAPRQTAFNAAKARSEAHELASLADKIPGEVDQLSRNVRPRDLDQQLKEIQKLAKRLRGELSL